jgi:excisionase family DNA binding protein
MGSFGRVSIGLAKMANTDIRKQEFVSATQEFARCFAGWWWDNMGSGGPITLAPQPATNDPSDPLLNLKEAAKLLKISQSTFKRRVRLGEIKAFKVAGKAARYKREEIERLIRRLK